MSGTLRLRLFGGVEAFAEQGGSAKTIGVPPAAKPLLAWLALHRDGPAARSRVAAELWPDFPQETAYANLRRQLFELAQRFKIEGVTSPIAVEGRTVSWLDSATAHLDTDEFDRSHMDVAVALEALDLYRGELAPEVDAEWILPFRQSYEQRFLTACWAHAQWFYRHGDHALALRLLQRSLSCDPWQEPVIRAAILIRARSGDRLGALTQFENVRLEMEREMQADVGHDLTAAADSIRNERAEEPFSAADKEMRPWLGSYSFYGRQKLLGDVVANMYNDATVSVLITGEPGIGKSRFGRELLHILELRGFRCFSAACSADAPRPYGALIDALGSSAPEIFAGPADAYVTLTREALARLGAHRRAALLIDDLQWADSGTLDLIGSIPSSSTGLTLILLCRSGTTHQNALSKVTAPLGVQIELPKLDPEAQRSIARDILGEANATPDVLDAIASASQGNPLFAQELARYTVLKDTGPETLSPLPPSVTATVNRRLSEFTTEELEVLEAAAVAGSRFRIDLILAVVSATALKARQTLRKARDFEILRADEAPQFMRFTHELYREAIAPRLLQDDAAAFHRRIAQYLSDHIGPHDSLEQLAYHWRECGENTLSAETYLRAGDQARAVYAFNEALRCYGNAQQLCPDDPIVRRTSLFSIGETRLAMGAVEEARVILRTLLDAVPETQRQLRAQVCLQLASCDWVELRRRSTAVWASRCLKEVEDIPEGSPLASEALAVLGAAAVLRGEPKEALDYFARSGDDISAGTHLRCAGYRGIALAMQGERQAAIAAVTEPSSEAIEACHDVTGLVVLRQCQGIVFGWFGSFSRAQDCFEEVVAMGKRAQNNALRALGLVALGQQEYYRANLRGARDHYDAAAVAAQSGLAKLYADALGIKLAAAAKDERLAARLVNPHLFAVCEEADDIFLINILSGALIDHAAAFGDSTRAKLMLKQYLHATRFGSGLWYVMPQLLWLADVDDLELASALAKRWSQDGHNATGKGFERLVAAALAIRAEQSKRGAAAAIAAGDIFERLELRLFVSAAERLVQLCSSGSTRLETVSPPYS